MSNGIMTVFIYFPISLWQAVEAFFTENISVGHRIFDQGLEQLQHHYNHDQDREKRNWIRSRYN